MQTSIFSAQDLHFAMQQVQDRDLLFTAVLAGMLNLQLKANPMKVVHHSRRFGTSAEYDILRFEVKKSKPQKEEFRRSCPQPDYFLTPVIDQPEFEREENSVRQRYQNYGPVMMLTNIGYTAPPPVELPVEEPAPGQRRMEPVRHTSYGTWEDVSYRDGDYSLIIELFTMLMEQWSEVFNTRARESQRLAKGQKVVLISETQPERWPNIPMYEVLCQVEPLIARDRNGLSDGLVDTIIQPANYGMGRGNERYAHSSDLYTITQYGSMLMDAPNNNHPFGRREDFKPSDWIINEVLNKIPKEFMARHY